MTELLLLEAPKGDNTAKQNGRQPTEMQKLAVEKWVELGGKHGDKGEAMRQVGYSEAAAKNPQKVFNSPAVMNLLDAAGLYAIPALKQLKRKVYSRRMEHMVFPLYNETVDGMGSDDEESEAAVEAQIEENLESIRVGEPGDPEGYMVERGKAMTDKQIVEMLEEQGCRVRRIQHGRTARHVYFWADNDKSQLDAIEKIINLHGLYAPKKSEVKAQVGVFSLSKLRRNMEENGFNIVKHEE